MSLWKVDVPGRGHSSPVVVGDLVVLTTADDENESQSVLAFDRGTGKPRWRAQVHSGGFAKKIHKKNTHATPTVASDGRRIFATFCNNDAIHVTALNMEGITVWQRKVGAFDPKLYEFGYAPSPLLYGKTVIVLSDFEKGFLAALKTTDGTDLWRTPRESNHVSYSSPIIGNIAGRDQILLSGREKVTSYDAKSGKLLWSVPGTTNATCGTMIWEGDLVFASGGYPKKETIAVRADGSNEVVWRNSQKCYEQSMLVRDGYIYAVNDNGIAYCWRAKDGKEMWKERLQGPVSASPTLVDGKIYATNERGTTFVFEVNPERYVAVAKNQLGDDAFALAGHLWRKDLPAPCITRERQAPGDSVLHWS